MADNNSGGRRSTERRTERRAKRTDEEYTQLLTKIKADFEERLARMAAQPQQWMEFIEQVAAFGAQYSLGNQILLLAQAAERGITPRWFLPYGRRDGSTGWRAHGRWVRAGETAYRVWAPVRRRPTEEQAQQWEAAGRKVARDPSGRPAVQTVGFRRASTFELSQTDGDPFEPPTVAHRRVKRLLRADVHGSRSGREPQLLTGDDPTCAYDDVVALIGREGYGFELRPPRTGYLGSANGITATGPGVRIVQIRDDLAPAQRIKTAVHELAHIRCEHPLDAARATTGGQDRPATNLHHGRWETEAESVAHIVCRALDLDSSGYSDAYVFGWAGGDLDLIKDCAETVLRVAKQILTDLTPPEPPSANPASTDPASAEQGAIDDSHTEPGPIGDGLGGPRPGRPPLGDPDPPDRVDASGGATQMAALAVTR